MPPLALGIPNGLPWLSGCRYSGGGGGSWSPGDATGLVQQLHDTAGDGEPWFKDKSQTGDDRILNGGPGMQRGQCLSFNGSNQSITHTQQSLSGDFTLCGWFNLSSMSTLWGKSSSPTYYVLPLSATSLRLHFNGSDSIISHGHTFPTSTWFHLAVVRSGSTISVYMNGVVGSTTGTNSGTFEMDAFGRWSSGYLNGDAFDVRAYDAALTADNITHIYKFGGSGTDPGLANCLYWYKLDEQSGSVAYDSNGNSLPGTLNNSPTYTTQDVYSWQNSVGYYLSGSVFVPRNEASATQDVLGNTLTYAGSAPRHGRFVNNHILDFNGSSQYGTVSVAPTTSGHLEVLFYYTGNTGDVFIGCNDAAANRCYFGVNSSGRLSAGIGSDAWTTIQGTTTLTSGSWYRGKMTWDGSTVELFLAEWGESYGAAEYSAAQNGSIPTGVNFMVACNSSNGTPVAYWGAKLADVIIGESGSDAHRYPIAEGSGSTGYDVIGDDDITWVNSPTWASQDVFAYNANYGFTDASGVLVPALQDTTLDAQGNAIGNPAVDGWNGAESDLDFDPYTIPALASGNLDGYDITTDYSGAFDFVADDLKSVDQHFALRENPDKDHSEFILYASDLSGDDWDNIHTYCSTISQINDNLVSVWTMNALAAGTPPTVADEVGSNHLSDSDDELLAAVSGKSGNAMHAIMTGGSYMDPDALDVAAPLNLNVVGSHYGWIKEAVQDSGGNDATVLDQNAQHTLKIINATGFLEWTYNGSTITGTVDVASGNGWHFYTVARDANGNLTLWCDGQWMGKQTGVTMPSATGTLKHFSDDGYDWEAHYDESGIAGTSKLRDNHHGWLHNLGAGHFINTTSNEYE